MSDRSDATTVATQFVAMSDELRQEFLLVYAHELTILARGYFLEEKFGEARSCNETIHRILGFVLTIADHSNRPTIATVEGFVSMLEASARERGWSLILRSAFPRG